MKRLIRVLLYGVSTLAVLLVVLLVSLSPLAAYLLTDQLRAAGFSQASVEKVEINLISNSIKINKLQSFSKVNNGFSFDRLSVNYRWRELLNNKLVIDTAALEGLLLRATRHPDGRLDLGFRPPAVDAPVEQAAAGKQTTPATWLLSLGKLSLNDSRLELRDSENRPIASMALNVNLTNLTVGTEGKATAEALLFEQFALQVQSQPVAGFQRLRLADIKWTALAGEGAAALAIESVALSGLQAEAVLDEQGAPAAVAPFVSAAGDAPKPVEEATDDAMPLQWRLGGLQIAGENRVAFTDNSVSPAVKLTLAISSLTLGEIDSASAQTETPFAIDALVGDHGKLTLRGEAAPLLAAPAVSAKTSVEGLDITGFSSYVADAVGYRPRTGQLYLDSDLKLSDKQISSDNRLRINKLTVEQADQEKADEMAGLINLPLDTALDLIRDKNDDVSLDIPIAGNIDNPDFAIGSVVNKALGKALQGASLAYLKYAIQPWGAVWMVGEKLTEQAQRVSFDPVVFQPGSSELDAQAVDYLASLAGLLNDKPFLRLTLCPVTNAADSEELAGEAGREAGENQLAALGTERGQRVKTQLVERFQLAPERLFNCPSNHRPEQKKSVVLVSM